MRPESAALGFAQRSSQTTSVPESPGTLLCAPLHRRESEALKGQGRPAKSGRQALDPGPSESHLGRTILLTVAPLYRNLIPGLTAQGHLGPVLGSLWARGRSSSSKRLRFGLFICAEHPLCADRLAGPTAVRPLHPRLGLHRGPMGSEWAGGAGGHAERAVKDRAGPTYPAFVTTVPCCGHRSHHATDEESKVQRGDVTCSP